MESIKSKLTSIELVSIEADQTLDSAILINQHSQVLNMIALVVIMEKEALCFISMTI
jgi:hypothetical protein